MVRFDLHSQLLKKGTIIMKAIAVYPGEAHSMHLEEIAEPKVSDIAGGRGVLVKVLRVGVDGTDKEINEAKYEPFDIIFEATGFSPMVFLAAEVLGKNGVLVLSSVTDGDTQVEVNADKINQGFVLGNKVMVGTVNASRADFVSGVNDLVKAEALYPGCLQKLLTTQVSGLENYAEVLRHLTEDKEAIKVYVEVA